MSQLWDEGSRVYRVREIVLGVLVPGVVAAVLWWWPVAGMVLAAVLLLIWLESRWVLRRRLLDKRRKP